MIQACSYVRVHCCLFVCFVTSCNFCALCLSLPICLAHAAHNTGLCSGASSCCVRLLQSRRCLCPHASKAASVGQSTLQSGARLGLLHPHTSLSNGLLAEPLQGARDDAIQTLMIKIALLSCISPSNKSPAAQVCMHMRECCIGCDMRARAVPECAATCASCATCQVEHHDHRAWTPAGHRPLSQRVLHANGFRVPRRCRGHNCNRRASPL